MTDHVFGAPIKRREDPPFLRGEAQFIADMSMPHMLHMAILRSPHGHARINRIDTRAATRMPGVVRVITAADLEGKLMPLPCIWIPGGVKSYFPPHPYGIPGAGAVLATDRVRFVGDAVAAVVAETSAQAYDALEVILVDYEVLPAVVNAEHALRDDAPQLHDAAPKNLNALWVCGAKESTDQAIANAEVVVSQRIVNQRTINNPLEPRGALGHYDPSTDEYTLYASSQAPHNHRFLLATLVLGIPFNKLRLVSPNIGGSFGTKGYLYPDMPLVLFLAKETGRPVKWVDTRTGMMHSTVQGRDHIQYGVLAGTRDGRITALRCTSYANLGAYPSTIGPGVATAMLGRSITGPYAIPNAFCEVYAVFTNKTPLGAQRGSGRAEATFLTDRLIDRFATAIGMDPAEVRRKNLITPDQFPYDNGLGWRYDSGDYPAMLDRALDMINYAAMSAMKAEARWRGKRLGVGVSCFVAVSGVGPSERMGKEGLLGGAWESANIRIHPTGEITLTVGSQSTGQSHDTTFAQVAADELGVDVAMIEVLHSDTKRDPYGQGTYGSRSFSVGGPAVKLTAQKIKQKICKVAAHIFNVAEDAIVYEGGQVYVKGAPEQAKSLRDMAMTLWYGWAISPGMEPNLDETTHFDPPDFNYPCGAHAAIVEIDEQSGVVDLVRFVAVSDVGNVGNPLVIDGQVQGGIAHGIGQALMEEGVYDDEGHLLTNTLLNYPMPRASALPNFELDRLISPTPHNALGAKGAGEIGAIGAPAAITNAVCNALAEYAVEHLDMPMTPEKVWRAIREPRAADAPVRQRKDAP